MESAQIVTKLPIKPFQSLIVGDDGEDKWVLTPEAHEFSIPAWWQLSEQLDQYKAMTGTLDRPAMALAISLFVLSDKNGPDAAKRLHLLQNYGATFQWLDRGLSEEEHEKAEAKVAKAQAAGKEVKEKEPAKYLDLHASIAGTTFLVAGRATREWKAEIEERLALHEEAAKTTTKI